MGDLGADVFEATTVEQLLAAGHLFDQDPSDVWCADFLSRSGHVMLLAQVGGRPVGFITGIEMAHPDKGVEMLLYELGVDEQHRRRGIGRQLVEALVDRARDRGCRGMWVPIAADDMPAIATYRSAGAGEPEEAGILSWEFPRSV